MQDTFVRKTRVKPLQQDECSDEPTTVHTEQTLLLTNEVNCSPDDDHNDLDFAPEPVDLCSASPSLHEVLPSFIPNNEVQKPGTVILASTPDIMLMEPTASTSMEVIAVPSTTSPSQVDLSNLPQVIAVLPTKLNTNNNTKTVPILPATVLSKAVQSVHLSRSSTATAITIPSQPLPFELNSLSTPLSAQLPTPTRTAPSTGASHEKTSNKPIPVPSW